MLFHSLSFFHFQFLIKFLIFISSCCSSSHCIDVQSLSNFQFTLISMSQRYVFTSRFGMCCGLNVIKIFFFVPFNNNERLLGYNKENVTNLMRRIEQKDIKNGTQLIFDCELLKICCGKSFMKFRNKLLI